MRKEVMLLSPYKFIIVRHQGLIMDNNAIEYKSLEMRLFGNDTVNSVSLREVYLDLGYKDVDFTTWCKRNLLEDFEENIDFVCKQNSENSGFGKQKVDYIVTLDTAKELAIMSKKPKGKLIRKYFIEVEKMARNKPQQVDTVEIIEARIIEKITDALIDTKAKLESKQEARSLIQAPEVVEAIEYVEEKKSESKDVFHGRRTAEIKYRGLKRYNLRDFNVSADPKITTLVFEYWTATQCIITTSKGVSYRIHSPAWVKLLGDFDMFQAKVMYRETPKKAYLDLVEVTHKYGDDKK